ncbi:hypothetical protein F4803DRAFT_541903 [Xylaria telfairii]|nr:hypothetical protein F4803DRAFT_541903 [Xylaria telfairii]
MTMEPFSDLQIVSDHDGRYGTNEYGPMDTSAPKRMPNHNDSSMPEAVPWEYNGNGMHTAGKEAGPGQTSRTPSSGQLTKRKCGMPRRVFYRVLALVVLLVAGGIAGGVAGGITSASKSRNGDFATLNTTLTNTSNNSPNIHVSTTSKLSVTNWTNPYDGTTHRFVFFQDPFNAIIARRWDSENRTWVTNNLTDSFSQTQYPINALTPSTPLASACCSLDNFTNKLVVHYIAPDNTLVGVFIDDLVNSPDTWYYDNGGEVFTTLPGSQIAAAWQRGYTDDSSGWWILAWQSQNGSIMVANSTDNDPVVAALVGDVVLGTTLALIPELDIFTPTLSRLTLIVEDLSSTTTGIVKKFTYSPVHDTPWYYDGVWINDGTIPPPTASL